MMFFINLFRNIITSIKVFYQIISNHFTEEFMLDKRDIVNHVKMKADISNIQITFVLYLK